MRWLLFLLSTACAVHPVQNSPANKPPLADWLRKQEAISWRQLMTNISPGEPKAPGQPAPLKGIVVAALTKKDPDYYFHWTRDAGLVMKTVFDVADYHRPYAGSVNFTALAKDYLDVSEKLQNTKSPFGVGDPRFQVTGEVDTLPWSRPQYDGPAIRAISVLKLIDVLPNGSSRKLALKVLKTDLDFVAKNYKLRGFDIWEEVNAENFHTRLVQLGALEKGIAFLRQEKTPVPEIYVKAAGDLEKILNDHWDPARGILRSQLVIAATDGYTSKKTDLDAAVVLAVLEAGRPGATFSVLDDRVQATVQTLEDLFKSLYPINAQTDVGLAYGRYPGDSYFGGNPWSFITADFAKFYYDLAKRVAEQKTFAVTKRNLSFTKAVLPNASVDSILKFGEPDFEKLKAALIFKGDQILARLERLIPESGEINEQFDKNSGQPVSAAGIAWGHADLIAAILSRETALSK